MPKVLNKKTDQIPLNAIYVGRPSKWGNPFTLGQYYQGRVMKREDVIEAYRDWLLCSDIGLALLSDIKELEGKDLVCWCAPLPCHADILLELAKSKTTDTI